MCTLSVSQHNIFLGDVGVVLQPGKKDTPETNCNNFYVPNNECIWGDNDYNSQMLHGYLRPGDYTLFLYEPVPQNTTISSCTAFDFSFDITLVDAVSVLCFVVL